MKHRSAVFGLLWAIAFAATGLMIGSCNSRGEQPPDSTESDWKMQRERMVSQQIEARGVKDPLVLESMREVPRHLFVPDNYRDAAYHDSPLPIGGGQTISQPYIVALMTELLDCWDAELL